MFTLEALLDQCIVNGQFIKNVEVGYTTLKYYLLDGFVFIFTVNGKIIKVKIKPN